MDDLLFGSSSPFFNGSVVEAIARAKKEGITNSFFFFFFFFLLFFIIKKTVFSLCFCLIPSLL